MVTVPPTIMTIWPVKMHMSPLSSCLREGATIHKLCSLVDSMRAQSSLTAAMRVFILTYLRAAENAASHQAALQSRKSTVPLELIVQMSGTPVRP